MKYIIVIILLCIPLHIYAQEIPICNSYVERSSDWYVCYISNLQRQLQTLLNYLKEMEKDNVAGQPVSPQELQSTPTTTELESNEPQTKVDIQEDPNAKDNKGGTVSPNTWA